MKKLVDCEGYKKLSKSVKYDCDKVEKCFNPNGCDKETIKCFHHYCDKFKWILERVKHYAEKTGLTEIEILNSWEKRRDYWYMNYYQDANQPKIKGDVVKIFNTKKELQESLNGKGFRCPNCKGISKNPYECNSENWLFPYLTRALFPQKFCYDIESLANPQCHTNVCLELS